MEPKSSLRSTLKGILRRRYKALASAAALCCVLGNQNVVLSAVQSDGSPNKWAVGVNTLFVQEYAMSLGIACPGCPGNVAPHTLAEIQATLLDLAANQHVGVFREIIPFELLSPNGTNDPAGGQMPVDSTNYAAIDAVIALYQQYNLHLILSLGNPIPAWAAPWGNVYGCFVPPTSDTADFYTFQNNLSWTVGNYLNHLKQKGFNPWMGGGPNSPTSGGLFVEGFNEWNANANYTNCSDFTVASPQRAALLEGGISWVANFYGVTVNFAAPSVVGPTQGLAGWYTSYYAAGGVGAPNVHIYQNGLGVPGSATTASLFAQTQLNPLIAALPANYRNQVIWGETGFGENINGCTGPNSMDLADWSWYDTMTAQMVTGSNTAISSAVQLLTVWRLDQLPQANTCEATFGVVSSDLSTYEPAGVNLFQYLGGTGVSPSGSSSGVSSAEPVLQRQTLSPFTLAANQSLTFGNLTFIMQSDGNLVLYEYSFSPLWAAGNTPGINGQPVAGRSCAACLAVFQSDGNLVLYTSAQAGTAYWASNTAPHSGYVLQISSSAPYVQIGSSASF